MTKAISKKMAESVALKLGDLRLSRSLSQEQIASMLDVRQPAVAKIEKKNDMYISTIRRYIEALGGQLEISARFPDSHVVVIKPFEK